MKKGIAKFTAFCLAAGFVFAEGSSGLTVVYADTVLAGFDTSKSSKKPGVPERILPRTLHRKKAPGKQKPKPAHRLTRAWWAPWVSHRQTAI